MKIFRHVTLPLLMPVLSFSVLMSITGAFVSNYDLVYVMTGGGPSHSTEVALTWIMNAAFQNHNVGKANAMSMVLFLAVAAVGAFQLRAMMGRGDQR
jgi:ABC-type sugar transport system permease subunit